jgi:hypothetical protein
LQSVRDKVEALRKMRQQHFTTGKMGRNARDDINGKKDVANVQKAENWIEDQ